MPAQPAGGLAKAKPLGARPARLAAVAAGRREEKRTAGACAPAVFVYKNGKAPGVSDTRGELM